MTGTVAYRAMKAAIQVMDKDELKECVELGQKVLGEKGVITGTSAKGKKAPVYTRVIKAFDPSLNNGYSIEGDFVNRGTIAAKAGSNYLVSVARGTGKDITIMLGQYKPGATHPFTYPSGANGMLTDIEVFATYKDWASLHSWLLGKGVPTTKYVAPTAAAVALADDDEVKIT